MRRRTPADAPDGRPLGLPPRPFAAKIVFRQVRRLPGARLWGASLRPGRWSAGFPALYTSLALEVALAERVKRTGPSPTDLLIGEAEVTLARIGDLTEAAALDRLQVAAGDLVGGDYHVTQAIATEAHGAGIGALLVPAAVQPVADLYPRMRLVRDRRRMMLETPRDGVNLVIFPNNLSEGDGYRQLLTYAAQVAGVHRARAR